MYLASYPIVRSMIVDKYIVSMSNAGIAIHALNGLDLEAKLSFTEMRKKNAATPIALR